LNEELLMSIRKPNFPSFLLPVVLVSFAPLLVNATATTPTQQVSSVGAVCTLPADAPAQFQARFAAADTAQKQAICAKIAAKKKADLAAAQPDPAGFQMDRGAALVDQTAAPAQTQDSSSGDVVVNGPSGADTLAAIKNKGASGSVDAPAPQPVIDPKPASVVLSPSKAHYLNSTDAQSIFSDLSIATLPQGSRGDGTTASKPTSASLAAIYPNACKDNFSVSSTSSDKTLSAPSGTVGFAIFDTGNTANGGLVQCMHDHAGDCDQDYSGTACSSMSALAHVAIAQDASVHIAYLDFGKRHDAASAQSSWTAQNISGSMNVLSNDMIQANQDAARDEAQRNLKNQIANCVKLGDLPVAQNLMSQVLDGSVKGSLAAAIAKEQAHEDQVAGNKELASIDTAIEEASQAGDPKASDKVEERINDFAAKHPDQADVAADRIETLAENLTGGKDGPSLSNTPSAAAIKDAKRMLSDLAGDDNALGISDSKTAEIKKFQSTLLVVREVQASVFRVYNLEMEGTQAAQKGDSKAQGYLSKAASEEKNAEKLQKNAINNFTNQLKKMGCIKETNTYAGKVEEDSQKSIDNDDLGTACNDLKSDRTEVENVVAQAQQQAAAAQQALQQQQQKAQQAAIAAQRAAMGQPAQQQGVIPMNTTFGPSGTNVANLGNPGFVGGLPMGSIPGYNGGFTSASPTTMSYGIPMQQMYNPYSYTGIAGMGSPLMTMPLNRGSSL
jgi:hypothetical protein